MLKSAKIEKTRSREFFFCPWNLVVTIGVALFKEGKQKQKHPKKSSQRSAQAGVGVPTQLTLAAIKPEIAQTSRWQTGHTKCDFLYFQGQVDNADLICFIL